MAQIAYRVPEVGLPEEAKGSSIVKEGRPCRRQPSIRQFVSFTKPRRESMTLSSLSHHRGTPMRLAGAESGGTIGEVYNVLSLYKTQVYSRNLGILLHHYPLLYSQVYSVPVYSIELYQFQGFKVPASNSSKYFGIGYIKYNNYP